jgi:hypothetical protein
LKNFLLKMPKPGKKHHCHLCKKSYRTFCKKHENYCDNHDWYFRIKEGCPVCKQVEERVEKEEREKRRTVVAY